MYPATVVRDLMIRGIYEVKLNDTIEDVVKVMGKNGISSVVVSDDNNTYWGIITEMDILKHYSENLEKLKAEDIMATKIIHISPIAPLEKAAQIMAEKKIHHLYVVSELREDKIIGTISAGDIIKMMHESLE
ncbi:putative signal-transduction protein with CBS domains [Methanococcus aeolicus Nankai-3]|uniref:Signal-transduction protein with CBS domains n=1 Tax=Methanococcus aeolicus (strain ATCC BAA-1280 / DSM 17508 / OCM 812 / Nankai-3) TaxID=419665 RepID=A6UUT4_META3|nr:CBS domain-containing protein [Methanococcus aeolicus]ABR56256.1 putative signal-transduction protein with CBS domains [Methanococcus aeolicus Nankai-3]